MATKKADLERKKEHPEGMNVAFYDEFYRQLKEGRKRWIDHEKTFCEFIGFCFSPACFLIDIGNPKAGRSSLFVMVDISSRTTNVIFECSHVLSYSHSLVRRYLSSLLESNNFIFFH